MKALFFIALTIFSIVIVSLVTKGDLNACIAGGYSEQTCHSMMN